MGFLKKLHRGQKEMEESAIKDLKNRADQFMQEYRVIRARHRCDFQSFIKFKENGEGGLAPSMRIIDITKTIEAEEEAERKKQETIEKQKLEGKSKNGNQKPQN